MKTKILVRSFLCLLAALMLLSCVACKKDDNGGTNAEVPTLDGGSDNLYDTIAKVDMGGEELVVASLPDWVACWEYSEYTGDVIDDLEFERSVAFKETYNCEVTIFEDNNLASIIVANYTGGISDFDLIRPHPQTGIVSLMTSGALANGGNISTLDFSSPWYNQSMIENYTVNDRIYLFGNDSLIAGEGFTALIYNKPLYDSYNLGYDIHSNVMERKWTAEQFKQLLVATESNDDNLDTKVYSLVVNEGSVHHFMYAFGGRALKKNNDGDFVVGLNTTNIVDICEAFVDVLYSGDYLLSGYTDYAGTPTSKMYTTFTAKRAVFYQFDVGGLYYLLRDLSFDLSYAPLPLINDTQKEYITFCGAGGYAIPSNAEHPEWSGIMVEYVGVHGYLTLKPAFFEVILNGRLSDHPDDAEMLNLLHSVKNFDMGFTLDSSDNVVNRMLRDVIMPVKTATGAVFWLRSNQNKLDALAATANTLGL